MNRASEWYFLYLYNNFELSQIVTFGFHGDLKISIFLKYMHTCLKIFFKYFLCLTLIYVYVCSAKSIKPPWACFGFQVDIDTMHVVVVKISVFWQFMHACLKLFFKYFLCMTIVYIYMYTHIYIYCNSVYIYINLKHAASSVFYWCKYKSALDHHFYWEIFFVWLIRCCNFEAQIEPINSLKILLWTNMPCFSFLLAF